MDGWMDQSRLQTKVNRQTYRDRETERQRDKEIGRQRDRETKRQR